MKQNASKHEAQSNKAIFNIGPNIVPYYVLYFIMLQPL